MPETSEPIELNSHSVDQGYRSCRNAVKKFFHGQLWSINNLPGEPRKAFDTLLFNLMRTIDLLDLHSVDGESLDVWHEIRNDLKDAFNDHCCSVELAALVDTTRKFNVPKQFLFDSLDGADIWIRNRKFETFEELDSFCGQIGGSSLASAMPILEVIKPGYEDDAILCGKAVMLTMLLANCVSDMKQNRVFFAVEDLEDCEVDISRVKLRRPGKAFRYLVRLYVSRIERLFLDSRRLVQYLDFDGKRSLKSLLAWNWNMLVKMKVEPECILSEEGVLSNRELLWHKSRHLMGIESKLPIVEEAEANHH